MTREDIKVGQVWEWNDGTQFKIIGITEKGNIKWFNIERNEIIEEYTYDITTLINANNESYCKLVNPYTLSKFNFV